MDYVQTKHFKNRIKERDINIDRIIYNLRDIENELRLYNNTGKELCYEDSQYMIILQVRNNKVILITALDVSEKENKFVKGGTIKI